LIIVKPDKYPKGSAMAQTRKQQTEQLVWSLVNQCTETEKNLWLAHNLGLMMGIVMRSALHDPALFRELTQRLEHQRGAMPKRNIN
jgi:hypothetical protein